MKCNNCGSEVAEGRMSCEKCGALVFMRQNYNSNTLQNSTGSKAKEKVHSGGNGVGFSIASMILGIVSLPLICVPYVPIICSIAGIILGGLSLYRRYEGRYRAIAGVTCSIISLAVRIILAAFGFFVNSIF